MPIWSPAAERATSRRGTSSSTASRATCTRSRRASTGFRTHDAEDVFQEVFARTYEHLDELRDDAAVRPWIGTLTRRLCVDRLRAAGREQPPRRPTRHRGPARTSWRELDEALTVHEALKELPEHCAEILDRFFARDESYRTIGEALDLPAGNDREPDLPLPARSCKSQARGKKTALRAVW